VKRHFGYEVHDELIMTPEKKFEIEFFNMLLNTALMSIKDSNSCINMRKLGVSCVRLTNY
jgi:hypothetical protein